MTGVVDYQWRQITADTWALPDDDGNAVRHVAKLGPYLGQSAATYRVTGPDYEATDHPSLAEAMTEAEASLG